MALAPKSILEIQCTNPAPPTDNWWSTGGGNSFPLNRDYEWDQVLTPGEEYDQFPVGASGWVINPHLSDSDLPMGHPFLSLDPQSSSGVFGDWEFKMAVDDPYSSLLSPANGSKDEGDGNIPDDDFIQAINLLKAAQVPNSVDGVLGVEIDHRLVPQAFQDNVKEGHRVALFGRWIVDQAHPNKSHVAYRAEIHPPLLMATGSIQQDPNGAQHTRVNFTSRPYLSGQRYTTDTSNIYDDSSGDDGAFKGHLINELLKVLSPIPLSFKVQFHPKIKSHPFLGPQLFHFIIRPPALSVRPANLANRFQLAVSFKFTVRQGCAVQVFSPVRGQVDVLVAMNHVGYTAPKLPVRNDHSWSRGDLNSLWSGIGDTISNIADILGGWLATLVGGPLNLAKWIAVVESGVNTDIYDPLPEVDLLGTSGAVLNANADQILAGQGIVVNNSDAQPFPIFGWLEARWVPLVGPATQ
jgi:hypothetical protein